MVEARVHFFGPVRSIAGKKEQLLSLDEGATLRDLLDELRRSNPPEFQRYIVIEGNTVNPALLVSVNGRSLDEIQNLDTPLPAGATVDVMLAVPIMGGALLGAGATPANEH